MKKFASFIFTAILLLLLLPTSVLATPIICNYLNFTEYDVGAWVDISTNNISFTGLPCDHATYVVKDFGTNYFTSVSHTFTMSLLGMDYGCFGIIPWALSDFQGDLSSIISANQSAIYMRYGRKLLVDGGQIVFGIGNIHEGVQYDSANHLNPPSFSYVWVHNDVPDVLTFSFYYDDDFTSLNFSENLSLLHPLSYRYLYALEANNIGSSLVSSGSIGDLVLNQQLGLVPDVTLYEASGNNEGSKWFTAEAGDITQLTQFGFGFQWGTTSGNYTDSQHGIQWLGNVFYMVLPQTNFVQGETYYYRAYATNNFGIGYSIERSFIYQSAEYIVTSYAQLLILQTTGNYTATFDVIVNPMVNLSDVYVRLSTDMTFVTGNITTYRITGFNTSYLLSTSDGSQPNYGQLSANTTYYWQAYVIVNDIYYWGGIKVFVTSPSITDPVSVAPTLILESVIDVSNVYNSLYAIETTSKIYQYSGNNTYIHPETIHEYGIQFSIDSGMLNYSAVRATSIGVDSRYIQALIFDNYHVPTISGIYNGERLYFRAYILTARYGVIWSNILSIIPENSPILVVTPPSGGVTPPITTWQISDFFKSVKTSLGLIGVMGSWAFLALILLIVALVFGIAMVAVSGVARAAIGLAWILVSIAVVGAFVFTGELGIFPIIVLVGGVVALIMIVTSVKLSGGGING